MQAEQIDGTLWQVTDAAGQVWMVAVRAGDCSAKAAVAVVEDILSPRPEVVAEALASARVEAARDECRRRILAVVPEVAQLNLTAAAAAGLLSTADRAAFRDGLAWIAAMRAVWPKIASDCDEPADADWPAVPEVLEKLAGCY